VRLFCSLSNTKSQTTTLKRFGNFFLQFSLLFT
jgi:hypothetical protein